MYKKNIIIMKNIIIILVFFNLFSCKTKKVYVETHSTDTIYKSNVVKLTPKRLNELVIYSPCDSLGNLKPFNYTLGSGNDKLIVKTIHNTIYIEQNLDSIKQSAVKEFQKSTKISEKIVEVDVIPKWIWKYLAISLGLNILFILYLFRKRIPILKLLPF